MKFKSLLGKLFVSSFVPYKAQKNPHFYKNQKENFTISYSHQDQRSFYPVAWLSQFTASAMLYEHDESMVEKTYPTLREI